MKKILFVIGLITCLWILLNGGCSYNDAQDPQSEKIEYALKDSN